MVQGETKTQDQEEETKEAEAEEEEVKPSPKPAASILKRAVNVKTERQAHPVEKKILTK